MKLVLFVIVMMHRFHKKNYCQSSSYHIAYVVNNGTHSGSLYITTLHGSLILLEGCDSSLILHTGYTELRYRDKARNSEFSILHA